MIEIGAGIELGLGVQIGAVNAIAAYFVTEIAEDFFITETGDFIIEE